MAAVPFRRKSDIQGSRVGMGLGRGWPPREAEWGWGLCSVLAEAQPHLEVLCPVPPLLLTPTGPQPRMTWKRGRREAGIAVTANGRGQ